MSNYSYRGYWVPSEIVEYFKSRHSSATALFEEFEKKFLSDDFTGCENTEDFLALLSVCEENYVKKKINPCGKLTVSKRLHTKIKERKLNLFRYVILAFSYYFKITKDGIVATNPPPLSVRKKSHLYTLIPVEEREASMKKFSEIVLQRGFTPHIISRLTGISRDVIMKLKEGKKIMTQEEEKSISRAIEEYLKEYIVPPKYIGPIR